ILLGGERGVGKSVLAAAIHSWGLRRQRDFTVIAGSQLSETTFATSLLPKLEDPFGGTVVIDEIADLSPKLQTWLASSLKRRAERSSPRDKPSAAARLVVTTRRDLDASTIAGAFRADLLHLVNVVSLRIPALRERCEDLPVLAKHVLRSFAELHERPALELT